jgi:hypothetical protein
MSIVSSVISSDLAQKDGRRWICEKHTDHLGIFWERQYLAGALDNVQAALTAYAIVLANNIRDAEIAHNISEVTTLGYLATPRLLYSTIVQNLAALRAAYLVATRTEAIFIGDYLSARTDAQLQTAFGMTAGQVNNLRTNKLTPAASAAATIRAATGA